MFPIQEAGETMLAIRRDLQCVPGIAEQADTTLASIAEERELHLGFDTDSVNARRTLRAQALDSLSPLLNYDPRTAVSMYCDYLLLDTHTVSVELQNTLNPEAADNEQTRFLATLVAYRELVDIILQSISLRNATAWSLESYFKPLVMGLHADALLFGSPQYQQLARALSQSLIQLYQQYDTSFGEETRGQVREDLKHIVTTRVINLGDRDSQRYFIQEYLNYIGDTRSTFELARLTRDLHDFYYARRIDPCFSFEDWPELLEALTRHIIPAAFDGIRTGAKRVYGSRQELILNIVGLLHYYAYTKHDISPAVQALEQGLSRYPQIFGEWNIHLPAQTISQP